MTPLFDQDSAKSSENRPGGGAPPAGAGHDEAAPQGEASDDHPRYPDRGESISPGPDPSEGVARSDAGEGADGAGPSGESAPAEAEADAEPEADPAAEAETETASVEAGPGDTAPTATSFEPVAGPLPPPPTLSAPESGARAPAPPPDPTPVGPPPAPLEPATAPSSAGPAPSQFESQSLAPIRANGRVAGGALGRLAQLWPSPVRAHPDQGVSSLVLLVGLAVTVGVVGAGVVAGLAFMIIALGHG